MDHMGSCGQLANVEEIRKWNDKLKLQQFQEWDPEEKGAAIRDYAAF